MLNEKLIELFPGEAHIYWSYDEAVDDTHNYYPEEFLNSLMPNGLPPHKLVLKKNSPINHVNEEYRSIRWAMQWNKNGL